MGRVTPPHQGFDGVDPSGLGVDLWLIVVDHLAVVDGVAELAEVLEGTLDETGSPAG